MIGVRLCWRVTHLSKCVRCMCSPLDFAALECCAFFPHFGLTLHSFVPQTMVQLGQLVVVTRELGNILLNQSNDQKLFWQHTANQSHRRCQQKTTPKLTVIKTFQHTWAIMQIQGNLVFSALITHLRMKEIETE